LFLWLFHQFRPIGTDAALRRVRANEGWLVKERLGVNGNCKSITALWVLAAFAGAQPSDAAQVEVQGDIGVASQYVWRGTVQRGEPVVQGGLGASVEGLSASLWFSNSYPSPEPQFAGKNVVEFDFTADYSGSVERLGYSVGGIYYTYLYDAHSNFVELYAGLSYDAAVSPSLMVFYTAKGVQSGFYKSGDIWVDFALSTSMAGLDMSATASYVQWRKDAASRTVVAGLDRYKSGISLLQVAVSKSIELAKLTIIPSLAVSLPLIGRSSDGNRYIYGGKTNHEFVAAVSLSF